MKLEEVLPRIYHIECSTQRQLCATFIRFQEHYESPHFKGKVFTLSEFKQWYITHSEEGRKTGKFTYYSDWNGFNIPSYVLQPFYQGKFDPLTQAEQEVLDMFRAERRKKFYIIGTHAKKKRTLRHEIAHGLYYTNSAYRKKAQSIVQDTPPAVINSLHRFLRKLGYDCSVFEDEVHAYLGEELSWLRSHHIATKGADAAHKQLKALYEQYAV